MKAATIHEIKSELSSQKQTALVELCLRLGRFKKENKELLTYLLFEAVDEKGYVNAVKKEIDAEFEGINRSNFYFVKKSLRKIIRVINRYCRYSGIRETEIELRIYFCGTMKASGIPFEKSPVLVGIFQQQLKKINILMEGTHEDLQYEYMKHVRALLG